MDKTLPPAPSAQSEPAFNRLPSRGPLVGRSLERSECLDLLSRPDVSLLTITGPGGVGKTRLALDVARELASSFEHGAAFAPLSQLRDVDLLPSVLCQALGLEVKGYSPLRTLMEHLKHRSVLLVLDNLEHLLEGIPMLAVVLAGASRVKVLATSRAPLRLSAEHEYPLGPLPLPAAGLTSVDEVAASESVALFVERARAVAPSFALTATNAAAIAEIVRRLDGLPLALELAAARVRVLSPDAILSRLTHQLPLLTDGPRDLPDRQRTLRATLDWSYDLLEPHEQTLLCRLGAFVGSFTLDAAQHVAGPDVDALSGLASLIEHSLLRRSADDSEPRFGMLATVREYALERLELDPERARIVREQHAAFYLRIAEEAVPHMHGPRGKILPAQLERDHGNLRAALDTLVESGDAERALRLGVALRWFWDARGHFSEGRKRLQALLRLPEPPNRSLRAQALRAAGVLARRQDDYSEAWRLLEESLAVSRELGDERDIAGTLQSMGNVALSEGKLQLARDLYEESLTLRRRLGSPSDTADALFSFGNALYYQGDFAQARGPLEEALHIFRGLQDRSGMGHALIAVGEVRRHQGDLSAARRAFEEAFALFSEVEDDFRAAVVRQCLGLVASDAGAHAEACSHFRGALDVYRGNGNRLRAGFVLIELGTISRREGRYDEARTFLEEALSTHRLLGSRLGLTASLHGLARLALAENRVVEAVELLREGFPMVRDSGGPVWSARYLETLAGAHVPGSEAVAARLLARAAELRSRAGAPLAPAEGDAVESLRRAVRAALPLPAYTAATTLGKAEWLEDAPPFPEANRAARSEQAAPASDILTDLTAREREVLREITRGLTNGQIATELGVSVVTVNAHVRSIYSKMNVNTRTAAARLAMERGLA